MAEQSEVQDALADLEKCLDGKHLLELKVLKNALKINTLKLQHKNEIQAKEIQILKLENENKVLKMKKRNDEVEETTSLMNVKQIEPSQSYNNMSTDDLLTDGMEKFFLNENEIQNTYQEWFEVMNTRLTLNTPLILERFVLVKVKCKNPTVMFKFTSYTNTGFYDQQTNVNIFNNGFRYNTSTVYILHPENIIKSIQMEEYKNDFNYDQWLVRAIPKEHIDKDGCFVILCLKNKTEQ